MTTQNTKSTRRQELPEEVVERLAGLLPREELEEALEGLEPEQITGPGGLLTQLAGRVIETALGAELAEHLGYPPGQAPPGGAANVRNGATPKTVGTELAVRLRKSPFRGLRFPLKGVHPRCLSATSDAVGHRA